MVLLFLHKLCTKTNYLSTFFLIHPSYSILLWFNFTCLLGLIHLVQSHSSTSHPVSCSLAMVVACHVFAGQLLSWPWTTHAGGSTSADMSTSFACSVSSWNRREPPTLCFNGKNVASCGEVCLCHLPSSCGSSPCRGMYSPAVTNFIGQNCETKEIAVLDLSLGF